MRKIKTEPNLKRRITATLVDYILYFSFLIPYMFTFGSPDGQGGYSVNGLPALLPMLIWFIYFPVIESFNGQTLGHRLAGIMVVSRSGEKIHLGQAAIRRFLDPIDIIFFFGLVGILTVKNNDLHQRVGDMVAGTIVIGGETQYCPECHTELSLDPKEALLGRFDCPDCGKRTQLH